MRFISSRRSSENEALAACAPTATLNSSTLPASLRFGYTVHDLLVLLERAGFRLFRQAAPDRIVAITPAFETEGCENLIAVRDPDDFTRRTGWTLGPGRA